MLKSNRKLRKHIIWHELCINEDREATAFSPQGGSGPAAAILLRALFLANAYPVGLLTTRESSEGFSKCAKSSVSAVPTCFISLLTVWIYSWPKRILGGFFPCIKSCLSGPRMWKTGVAAGVHGALSGRSIDNAAPVFPRFSASPLIPGSGEIDVARKHGAGNNNFPILHRPCSRQ